MNTIEVQEALKKIPSVHVGVYPADRIPKIWSKPTAFVINTKNHDHPGEHWVAVYVDRTGRAIFFDSYGQQPVIPSIIQRLRRNCIFYKYNKKQIQSFESDVCGQYCFFFSTVCVSVLICVNLTVYSHVTLLEMMTLYVNITNNLVGKNLSKMILSKVTENIL